MINVAVAGLGHWGPNLARNVAALPDARLHTLCDVDRENLDRIGRRYPHARRQESFSAVVVDDAIDAVMIATPVNTHFELASAALKAGKHTFVEKPLAYTSGECSQLIALAEQASLTLMVGHVFLYNAAVRKVKEYIESGELGEIYYVYSQRLNLGTVRQDVNALWNFAPHDLSILSYWLDADPERVFARGYSYVQPGIEDVVFMTLDFPGGVGANVHISWLDPNKVRRMTVVGSRKMVVYDDTSADAKIVLYDKGVTRRPNNHPSLGRYESFGEFQLLLRAGDVLIPKLDFVEPLRTECQHFVEAVRTGQQPITDGYEGLRVVQVLEAAQEAIAQGEIIRSQ
jgi:predicted dehydrogenase